MRCFNIMAGLGGIILLCILPLACSPNLADGVIAPKAAALWFGSVLLCSGIILKGMAAGDWIWSRNILIKLGLAGSLWSFFCCAVNGFHSYAIPGAICSLIYAALLYLWPAELNERKIWNCLGGLTFVAVITGLYAHLQRLTLADYRLGSWHIGDFMHWQPAHLAYERTIATMGNPDYFAAYLAAVLPLALAWIITRPCAWQKWLGLVLWSSSASAMILTQTRSAWLGAAVSAPIFLVMAWKSTEKQQRKALCGSLLFAFFLTLAGTIAIYQWQKQLHPQLDLAERVKNFASQNDLSIQARYYFWHTALRSARLHPAAGLGSGGHAVRSMQDRDLEPIALRFPTRQMENVHSQYLQTLAENGWPGLLLLILILAVYTRTLISARPDMLSAGLLSSAAALWTAQFFVCSTYQSESLWIFLMSAAAAWASGRRADTDSVMSDNAAEASDMMSKMSDIDMSSAASSASSPAEADGTVEEIDWHYLSFPTLAALFCICFTAAASFFSLRCEYDIDQGQIWQLNANHYIKHPEYAAKARDYYLLSEQYYMRALEAAPVWRQAYIYRSLGILVQDMYVEVSQCGDEALYENAQETFEEALRFNAYEPYTYSCLANLQRRSPSHLNDALQNSDKALQLDPLSPLYLNQKAQLLLQAKRYAEGRDTAVKALEFCPLSPYLWETLAKAHRYTGEYDLAEKDLENMLKLAPDSTAEADRIRKIEKAVKE